MNRYYVLTFIASGFMPKDKLLFKTRYKRLAYLFAKFYRKYFLKPGCPLAIETRADTNIITDTDWIVPWATDDERKQLTPVDFVPNHSDVVKIDPGPQEPLPPELAQAIEDFEKRTNDNIAKTILTEEQYRAQKAKNTKLIIP